MSLLPIVAALLAVCAVLALFSLHRIEEGHVGVYWRGGALVPRITDPGYHLKVRVLALCGATIDSIEISCHSSIHMRFVAPPFRVCAVPAAAYMNLSCRMCR